MSRPIVLLHGWGYRPNLWEGLALELAPAQVLAPALPYSAASLADGADKLAPLIPDGSLLVGWSLGAMFGLNLAARHPGKLAGLLLIGASPRFVACEDWAHGLSPEVVSRFEADFARAPERTLRRFLALQVLGDQGRAQLSGLLEAHLAGLEDSAQLAQGLKLLAQSDLREALPSTVPPCLLLHGEQDALMPVGAAHFLHEHLAGSRLKLIPNAGHAPCFSEPKALAALIRELEHEAG